ncbi:MAG: hypothetical protein M3N12_10145 [Verrucomicrobiota bacterium]|nr:hypothetical protein [Verrucomicrobiota bacterium]
MKTLLIPLPVARLVLVLLTSCLALSFAGCVSVDKTQTQLALDWNGRTSGQPTSGRPWVGFPDTPEGKNELVYEGIAVKDYEYMRYTQLIRRGTSWGGFGAQTASIGLNAAGTLTSSGTTKVLSAIAGTITGSSAAFSKNVLFDQSITSFIGKMDALRLTKLAEIKTKLLAQNINSYSRAEAYRDVQDYGRLGTLDAAFADVGKKAGTEQAKAQADLAGIDKGKAPSPTP